MEPVLLSVFRLVTPYVNSDAQLWLTAYQEDPDVPALFFTDSYREQLAIATVNLGGSGRYPAEGNVFIKTWSENEGILEALIERGIISEPVRKLETGQTEAVECKLLVTSLSM